MLHPHPCDTDEETGLGRRGNLLSPLLWSAGELRSVLLVPTRALWTRMLAGQVGDPSPFLWVDFFPSSCFAEFLPAPRSGSWWSL